jgi:hypothetical protein
MLSTAEIDEHPENIEGLEGLDPSWEINYNELEFGNELARGNFGEAWILSGGERRRVPSAIGRTADSVLREPRTLPRGGSPVEN